MSSGAAVANILLEGDLSRTPKDTYEYLTNGFWSSHSKDLLAESHRRSTKKYRRLPHEVNAEVVHFGLAQQPHSLVDVRQRVGSAARLQQSGVKGLDAHAHPRYA